MTSKFNLAALDSRCDRVLQGALPKRPSYAFRGSDVKIPSVNTSAPFTAAVVVQQYTGTAMIGIGQLHKSNAVPIFRAEDAEDLAHMRR